MVRASDFNTKVPLPPGLTITAIRKTIDYIERELADLVDLYYEQANVFSGIVGIYGVKGLDANSVYEKSRHRDEAQQRFPDLRRRGSGVHPSSNESLESKGSKRPWAIQSHYGHPGWYVVWRYLVDPTMSLEESSVDVAYLEKNDWKYEGSTAGSGGGGRTHTFSVRDAAKRLSGKAVYQRRDVRISGGKPVPANGN